MYSRNVKGRELTFTFDPNKYLDNLMLTDIETASLWSQLELRALDGQLRSARLQLLPTVQTTWKHWRSMFPDTRVFDLQSSHGAALTHRSLQQIGERNENEMESSGAADGQIGPLKLVLGLTSGTASKAYPFFRLAEHSSPRRDSLGIQPVLIHFDRDAYAAWATDSAGVLLPAVTAYWSVWQSFHPDTTVWGADSGPVESAAKDVGGRIPADATGNDSSDQDPAGQAWTMATRQKAR